MIVALDFLGWYALASMWLVYVLIVWALVHPASFFRAALGYIAWLEGK